MRNLIFWNKFRESSSFTTWASKTWKIFSIKICFFKILSFFKLLQLEDSDTCVLQMLLLCYLSLLGLGKLLLRGAVVSVYFYILCLYQRHLIPCFFAIKNDFCFVARYIHLLFTTRLSVILEVNYFWNLPNSCENIWKLIYKLVPGLSFNSTLLINSVIYLHLTFELFLVQVHIVAQHQRQRRERFCIPWYVCHDQCQSWRHSAGKFFLFV